jgi:hypothetical protein
VSLRAGLDTRRSEKQKGKIKADIRKKEIKGRKE